jgi:GMP synthase (glutamine-hydrolysing)
MRTTRLLVVDLSIDPGTYPPVEHWTAGRQLAFDSFRPLDTLEMPEVRLYSHAIFTGSEASITGDEPWITRAEELVVALVRSGIPLLGSCFGHQLLVRALSGRPYVRASSTPEFGWLSVRQNLDGVHDPLWRGIPNPFQTFSAHFDEVNPIPADWVSLGASPGCRHAMIRFRHGPVWGIQHHPEISVAEGQRLLLLFRETMPPGKAVLIRENLFPEPQDSRITDLLMANFLSMARPGRA